MAVATPGAAPSSHPSGDALQRAEDLGCVGERHAASLERRGPVDFRLTPLTRRVTVRVKNTHASLLLLVIVTLVTILAMTHTPIPEALSASITALVTAIVARLTPSPTR